ncbi:MAG: carboxypeptidase regulatory-like domain-containing protein [Geobacter sp.]|nr:MAG: carboxypeptidase regulatory-like domain-containing protein [Geobacter sp.]
MKRMFLYLALSMAVCVLALSLNGFAAETSRLKGTVLDSEGRPAEGAKLFIYGSSNVKRQADFISPMSGSDGRMLITLPAGRYWAVARLKKDGNYGPLMPGDKHSGEPVEIDMEAGRDTEASFVVADIREVGQKKRADTANSVRLWGRVVDAQGNPVANAYVFANREKDVDYVPDYLSPWTDETGNYSLSIPATGRYFVGSVRQFPLPSKITLTREVVPVPGKSDIALDLQLIVY